MSQRTIERDLRSLNDAGVPIYGTAGRTGGYAILPEHAMPPLQLSPREATAVVVALGLLDRSPLAPHARTALDKLRLSLPAPIAGAAQIDLTVRTVAASPTATTAPTTAAWLEAIGDRVLVELTYDGGGEPRLVEPYTTLEGGGSWYLVGWCRTKSAVRGFRTDRIGTLRLTATPFAPLHAGAVAEDLARWPTELLT